MGQLKLQRLAGTSLAGVRKTELITIRRGKEEKRLEVETLVRAPLEDVRSIVLELRRDLGVRAQLPDLRTATALMERALETIEVPDGAAHRRPPGFNGFVMARDQTLCRFFSEYFAFGVQGTNGKIQKVSMLDIRRPTTNILPILPVKQSVAVVVEILG